MTLPGWHAVATRVLWIGCTLHLLVLLFSLPYDLGHAPASVADTLALIVPALLLVTYGITFVTAPPHEPGAKRRWTNGQITIAWLVLAVFLLASNLLSHMTFGF